jgi:hypothetical protein
MRSDAQFFGHKHPAPAAHLRRVLRVHSYQRRTSFFRFVRQQLPEQPQRSVVGAQGQVFIARSPNRSLQPSPCLNSNE